MSYQSSICPQCEAGLHIQCDDPDCDCCGEYMSDE